MANKNLTINPEDYKFFGDKLRKYLKDMGMTQTEFAEQVGTSTTTVNSWVNGCYPHGLQQVFNIIRVLYDKVENFNPIDLFLPDNGIRVTSLDLPSIIRDKEIEQAQGQISIELKNLKDKYNKKLEKLKKNFNDSVNKRVAERTTKLQAEIERIKKEYSVEEVDKIKKENEKLRNRISNNQYRREYNQFKEKLEEREECIKKRLEILEDFIINIFGVDAEEMKSLGKSVDINKLTLTQKENRVKRLFKNKKFLSLLKRVILYTKRTLDEQEYITAEQTDDYHRKIGNELEVIVRSIYYDYYEYKSYCKDIE